jgi:hypothetical protein
MVQNSPPSKNGNCRLQEAMSLELSIAIVVGVAALVSFCAGVAAGRGSTRGR